MHKVAAVTVLLALVLGHITPARAERSLYSLERFELSSLRVEVIGQYCDDSRQAIIRDPDGYGHRVAQGDYVGNANGRIVEITETEVVIEETLEPSLETRVSRLKASQPR